MQLDWTGLLHALLRPIIWIRRPDDMWRRLPLQPGLGLHFLGCQPGAPKARQKDLPNELLRHDVPPAMGARARASGYIVSSDGNLVPIAQSFVRAFTILRGPC